MQNNDYSRFSPESKKYNYMKEKKEKLDKL